MLNKFEMVLYDLHTGPTVSECAEMIGIDLDANSASVLLAPNPLLDVVKDGSTTWLVGNRPSAAAYRHGGCDEGCIESISSLSEEEIRRSVVLRFENVDHFDMHVAFVKPVSYSPPVYDTETCRRGHLNSGRNILYSWGGPRWCGESEEVTMSGTEQDDWIQDP